MTPRQRWTLLATIIGSGSGVPWSGSGVPWFGSEVPWFGSGVPWSGSGVSWSGRRDDRAARHVEAAEALAAAG